MTEKKYPWQNERLREDVMKGTNLQLNEVDWEKFNYLVKIKRYSKAEVFRKLVKMYINSEFKKMNLV